MYNELSPNIVAKNSSISAHNSVCQQFGLSSVGWFFLPWMECFMHLRSAARATLGLGVICSNGSCQLHVIFQPPSGSPVFTGWQRVPRVQKSDLPGGPVVKNLHANAGNMGLKKIPHAVGQLSLCTTATEPLLKSLCSATREATRIKSLQTTVKSSPHSPQLEKAHAQ